MTVIIFIIVLLVVVLVHEWGHFITAKKSGMAVEEFGFGIPPKLWSFKRGETEYSINVLPIGGFVRIAGENGLDESIPAAKQFESKPWYVRVLVLAAGVICNFLLAIVLFTLAYTLGMPTQTPNGTPTIVTVVPGSPADQTGLQPGDIINSVAVLVGGDVRINIEPLSTDTIHDAILRLDTPDGSANDSLYPMSDSIEIHYVHQGEESTVTLIPEGEGESRKIGLGIEPISIVRQPFFTAVKNAVLQVTGLTIAIWQTLAQLVAGLFTGGSSASGLIGPVGLAREVGSAATIGFAYLLAFTAAISVNLAVLNIMPFPALDGGRILVVVLETIARRKFSAKAVGIIHAAGFLLLLALMLFLTVGDIRRLL